MTEEVKNVEITVNDLMVIRSVFDAATQRGIFKATDLSVVGNVFDKVNYVVEDFIAKNKPEEETTEGE